MCKTLISYFSTLLTSSSRNTDATNARDYMRKLGVRRGFTLPPFPLRTPHGLVDPLVLRCNVGEVLRLARESVVVEFLFPIDVVNRRLNLLHLALELGMLCREERLALGDRRLAAHDRSR